MDDGRGIAPHWHLLRLIEGGHTPHRGEAAELEDLVDRGLVEDWTTGSWRLTDLGRSELHRIFDAGDVPTPRASRDVPMTSNRTAR